MSALTHEIREILTTAYDGIWVSGEISGLKLASSGHAYFNLKDASSQIRCAIWKGNMRLLRFKPQEGMAVLARGRIDVYEPRGEYQFIIEALEPQGQGALQLAFEQLKARLDAEGLFAAARKRPLPRFPRRIAIVTSPTGAVIQDMIHVLTRRFPGLHIRLYPALVQGPGSVEAIVEGIRYFAQSGWGDVLIVGRGGGSLEDLWSFNEEAVARAIAASPFPVISAVGHETDFTIADFVADLRAPTPSAAAERAVRDAAALIETLAAHSARLERATRFRALRFAQRFDDTQFRLRDHARARLERLRRLIDAHASLIQRADPRLRLAQIRQQRAAAHARLTPALQRLLFQRQSRVASLAQRLAPALTQRVAAARATHERLHASLMQLSPIAVLERGYSIVQAADGSILRDASNTSLKASLAVRLHKGALTVKVTKVQ
ncbi:MAG: exodeoxyribonuclease VII large subunit [Acidobacteriota bacterium]